ncbi:serine rich and transmembrane domain containing 1 [Gadus chalcogrammus]|uniref:serine rich and transmembrane domain containing 1 n=1 Tax=Gadus chalcogrammus TaxID=1042646 RepID=UPI0024C3B0EE|nr:serine rich and transmembrane domain containing 1 [Gadus chalcogrammus]
MSGMEFLMGNRSETALIPAAGLNGTFPRVSHPTGASAAAASVAEAAAAAADLPRRPAGSDVYVYVWIFLSLLAFLLTLLVISLHRLKNIITSSSSLPDCSSAGGGSSGSDRTSSFTNMEICSISSQKSTVSTLSN